jgi:hypothetical protein
MGPVTGAPVEAGTAPTNAAALPRRVCLFALDTSWAIRFGSPAFVN